MEYSPRIQALRQLGGEVFGAACRLVREETGGFQQSRQQAMSALRRAAENMNVPAADRGFVVTFGLAQFGYGG